MNLLQLSNLTEEQTRDYLESIRWPEGARCAHCASENVRKLEGASTRPGV